MLESIAVGYWGRMLATFILSMAPVVEVRGGIPFGAATGLDPLSCAAAAILGNMLPVPFIILFIRHIFKWLKKFEFTAKIVNFLETKAYAKGHNIKKYEWIGLWLFVGVPLPGTGAWTGALIAALLNMNFKRSISSIFVGVLTASIIVGAVTYGAIALAFFLV